MARSSLIWKNVFIEEITDWAQEDFQKFLLKLLHLERFHECWKVLAGFRATYASLQQGNTKPHTAIITTA